MGQRAELTGLECRDDACQKPGEVAGVTGTWAVKHCHGIVTGATFSVTYVPNTEEARSHFQAYGHHVSDPLAQARSLHEQWVATLTGAGWGLHADETEPDGTHWVRVVSAPHARLIRVSSRSVGGLQTATTSLVASATDPSCPRP